MITSVIKFFLGSTPDDFDSDMENHPFNPCPDTPNCAIHSVEFPVNEQELFEAAKTAIDQISPFKKEIDSHALHIHAVFRIHLFGFKDDVSIIIKSKDSDRSILHIKSSSRVGRSDLGVNRRRIKRIISVINQKNKL